MIFRQVTYSFQQLARWRDLGLDLFFPIPGVRHLDVDEVQNTFEVGVDPDRYTSVRSAVLNVAAANGIPQEALEIIPAGQFERHGSGVSSSVQTQTLQSFQRPLQAGFQIQGKGICSIGWVTRYNLSPAFVTASHCSTQEGILDFDDYYQALPPSAVGYELAEAPVYSCGGEPCHYGDVNVVAIVGSPFEENVIGRPVTSGGIAINTSQPRFYVTSEFPESVVGEFIGKVGRTTGWTTGEITATCVSYTGESFKSLCMDRATTANEQGDSGGPVFYVLDYAQSTVSMVGIHAGRTLIYYPCCGWQQVFTPMSVVHSEFPGLELLPH